MIPLSAEKSSTRGFNVMAVYEASRHATKNHLSLHRHPEVSLDGGGRDPSDSPRKST